MSIESVMLSNHLIQVSSSSKSVERSEFESVWKSGDGDLIFTLLGYLAQSSGSQLKRGRLEKFCYVMKVVISLK